MSTVLSVRGISKSFGGVRAVDDVSFDVSAGQIVALIGPNGAGKSTCFNVVNGQVKPNAGRVSFGNDDITGWKPRDIWGLGVGRTFQITQTYGSMTVLENVQMTLLSFHHRLLSFWRPAGALYVDEAMTLLRRVSMAEQSQRGCGVLAYGDLKRVELAVALANQPRLLLMDEPTAGMAPKERVELMRLTAEIARERSVAVLFTEHDMDVVFAHADHIIVLNRGRIIARGDPSSVRNNSEVREVYLGSGSMYH
jgi:branched-chain amino acid transport system ATP-binding protein